MKWRSRLILSKGREFLKAIEAINLAILSIGKPIYRTSYNKKNLLIYLTSSTALLKNGCHIESYLELSSDHSSVIITINGKVMVK
jgi:hypothetical protein